jgi:hypothetical protein
VSINVIAAILDAEGLSPNEKIVAISYADNSHHDGTEARTGLDRIAQKSSLSRRTVNAVIKMLLEKGVMEVQRPATNKNPVCYRFILTPDEKSLVFRGATSASQDGLGVQNQTLGVQNTHSRGAATCTLTVSEPLEPLLLLSDEVAQPTKFEIQFDQLWKIYPKKRGKTEAGAMVRARLREKVSFEDLMAATLNYVRSRVGEDPQFTVWPKRFYNKTYWKDFLPDGAAMVEHTRPKTRDELLIDVDQAVEFVGELFNHTSDEPTRPLENALADHLFDSFTRRQLGRMTTREIRDIIAATVFAPRKE